MTEKQKQAGLVSALTIAQNQARAKANQQRAVAQAAAAKPKAAADASAKVLVEESAAAIKIQADEAVCASLAGIEMSMDFLEWIARNGNGDRIENAATLIQARFRGNTAREAYWQTVAEHVAR